MCCGAHHRHPPDRGHERCRRQHRSTTTLPRMRRGVDESAAGDGPARKALFDAGWMKRVTDATQSELLAAGTDAATLEIVKLRGLFRTSFSHAPLGMALVDAAGQIVLANERCAGLRAGRRKS